MATQGNTQQASSKPTDPRIQGLMLVGGLNAAMWAEEIVDQVGNEHWDKYGIQPHHISGLKGIILAPFLHASYSHLIGNTLPFLVLGALIALNGIGRVAAVTAIVTLIGGMGVWIFAPGNSVHIGASGVVFGYAAYLISRSIFSKNWIHLAIGVVVVAVWGTTLLRSLAPHQGISWQGHLFGAVGGVITAYLLDRKQPKDAPPPAKRDPIADLLAQ